MSTLDALRLDIEKWICHVEFYIYFLNGIKNEIVFFKFYELLASISYIVWYNYVQLTENTHFPSKKLNIKRMRQ